MAKERVLLIFSTETYDKALTYHLIHDCNVKINILKASITPGKEGHLLIDIDGSEEDVASAYQYLTQEQIKVVPANRQISIDKDLCIHCGACTAVCFAEAMSLNRDSWQVEFSPKKCIACGLCVNACPLRIISIAGDNLACTMVE
ncbi:MAG: methionine transporter [Firmicutes bacterium]|nr:methionine transporter [Bacillota bacterium]